VEAWRHFVCSVCKLVSLVSGLFASCTTVRNNEHSDIAFYGINLNQTIVLTQIGYGKGPTPYQTLKNTAVGNIIVQSAGYLPGYYVGIFLPDLVGRVRLQFCGCVLMAVIYAIWAGITKHTSTAGLMTIFAISQFVLNCTVNMTTFLLPVELFPTRVRASAHGIAAASGKAGAVLTAFAFGAVVDSIGLSGTLGLFSGIMALTACVTLLIPETRGKTLEDIESDVLYGILRARHDDGYTSEPHTSSGVKVHVDVTTGDV